MLVGRDVNSRTHSGELLEHCRSCVKEFLWDSDFSVERKPVELRIARTEVERQAADISRLLEQLGLDFGEPPHDRYGVLAGSTLQANGERLQQSVIDGC